MEVRQPLPVSLSVSSTYGSTEVTYELRNIVSSLSPSQQRQWGEGNSKETRAVAAMVLGGSRQHTHS